jgi:hypothetical protein
VHHAFPIAAVALTMLATAACTVEPTPVPAQLQIAHYTTSPLQALRTESSVEVESQGVIVSLDSDTTVVAVVLSDLAATRLAEAMTAVRDGWNGPYTCAADCLGGEHYFFTSADGPVRMWHPPGEPLPELEPLHAVLTRLIAEVPGCYGLWTHQCSELP